MKLNANQRFALRVAAREVIRYKLDTKCRMLSTTHITIHHRTLASLVQGGLLQPHLDPNMPDERFLSVTASGQQTIDNMR